MLAEIAHLYLFRYCVYILFMNAVLSKSWKCRFLEEEGGNSMIGCEKFLQSSVNIIAGAFLTSADGANSFQTITRNNMPFITDISMVCRLKSSMMAIPQSCHQKSYQVHTCSGNDMTDSWTTAII